MNCIWGAQMWHMELYEGNFTRPQSWFYLMVTRYLFDRSHSNSISNFMTDVTLDLRWDILRAARDREDREHILFGEIKSLECFRHVIRYSEVRSLYQGMTKQINNNFPDPDLEDILHNSVVTSRRDDISDNSYRSYRHLQIISQLVFPSKDSPGSQTRNNEQFLSRFCIQINWAVNLWTTDSINKSHTSLSPNPVPLFIKRDNVKWEEKEIGYERVHSTLTTACWIKMIREQRHTRDFVVHIMLWVTWIISRGWHLSRSPPSLSLKSTATFHPYCQLSTLPQCRYRSKCIKVMLLSDTGCQCIKHHEKIVWIFDFSILYPLPRIPLFLSRLHVRMARQSIIIPTLLAVAVISDVCLQSSPADGLFCWFCLLNSLCRRSIQCQCWIMKELLGD